MALGINKGDSAPTQARWTRSCGAAEAVWATTPPAPECGQSILNAYFENRPRLENIWLPTWDGLANVVVQPSGSAPGRDGIPNETFHHGIMFVSCFIGQAFYAAQISNTAIERVLGPSIDILVWILKGKGGERPSDMRPLQFPTCFRRLFGVALASVVGPAVERHLCNDQAAKAGGSCGPNIRRAYQHLEAGLHHPRSAGSLWFNMLGDSQDSMDSFIEQHLQECEELIAANRTVGPLTREAAILFADQRQAFERLSIRWFKEVLAGWHFPQWVQRSFTALVENRSVTAAAEWEPSDDY